MYAAFLAALAVAGVPAAAADRSSIERIAKPVNAGAPWTQAERAALRVSLDTLLADAPALRGAHAGAIVVESRSGDVLYERRADERFLPASAAKLVTGFVALAQLGTDFRFTTEVRATGPVARGEVQGDLVLRGGGDPLLSAADLDDAAATLARAGVRRITGGVRADSSYFEAKRYGDGWSVDDIPFDYMPVLSALSLEENAVHLTIAPGANAGDPALLRTAPLVGPPFAPTGAAGAFSAFAAGSVLAISAGPTLAAGAAHAVGCPRSEAALQLANQVTTGARDTQDTVDVTRGPCDTVVVAGSIPLGAAPDDIDAALPNPEAYAVAVFRAALAARGIAVGAAPFGASARSSILGGTVRSAGDGAAAPPARGGGREPGAPGPVLWSHASEPLSGLLADFWYPSDNLIGEALLRALGVARAGPPGTDAAGLALVREELAAAGIPAGDIDLADGSGLSRYDLATPRALATILQADWNGPFHDLVLDALPVAGVRGTLAHAFAGTPLEQRVFAKSGSMTHVSALAGYLATQRHGAVTFALLVDGWLGEARPLDDLRARLLSRVATD